MGVAHGAVLADEAAAHERRLLAVGQRREHVHGHGEQALREQLHVDLGFLLGDGHEVERPVRSGELLRALLLVLLELRGVLACHIAVSFP